MFSFVPKRRNRGFVGLYFVLRECAIKRFAPQVFQAFNGSVVPNRFGDCLASFVRKYGQCLICIVWSIDNVWPKSFTALWEAWASAICPR